MSPLASSPTADDDDRDHHHRLHHDHHHHHSLDHSLDHLDHDQVLEPIDQDLNSVLSEAAQVEAALLLHHHRFATLGSISHDQHDHSHEHQYTIDHTGIVENYPSASGVDGVGVSDPTFRDLDHEHHHDHTDNHHNHHSHHHHDHLDSYASAEGDQIDQMDLPREISTNEIDKQELGAYPSHEIDNQATDLNEDVLNSNQAVHSQRLEPSIGSSSEDFPPKKKARRLGPKASSLPTSADLLAAEADGQAVAEPSSSANDGLDSLDNGLSRIGADKPVRKKGRVQVSNACTNCQKSRKKCSGDRPCTNCIGHPERVCENSSRTARAKGIKRGPYKKKDRSDPRHLQNFPHIQSAYDLYNSNPDSATSDSHPSGSNSLSGSPVTDPILNPIHHTSNPGSLPNNLSGTSAGQTHHTPPTYEGYDVSDGSRDAYAQIDVNGGQGGFTLVDSEDLNSQLLPLSLPSDHLSLNEDSPMGQPPPPPPPNNRSFLERLKEDVFGRKALMAATAVAALTGSGAGGALLDPRLTSSATHLDHDLLVSLANLPQETDPMHTDLSHSHLDPHQSDQSVSQDEHHHHHSGLSLDSLQEVQALSATVDESRQAAEAEAVVALSRRLELDLAQDQDQDQALDLERQDQEVQEVTE
ncbi:Zn(2)-C6 fungal-type DNA-binding domain [Phaffia rhodozyma]|uniref:Zn(2)-C6 fungal-type DNA-binding domain n=1 Tax=Phaffia rhodozyma TaxID=264483 RepID=A0A0F7SI35_PHARH|nr:Zn(2)-C6 fungal-type DNA-binding domain [Phaffia rhodozyma]